MNTVQESETFAVSLEGAGSRKRLKGVRQQNRRILSLKLKKLEKLLRRKQILKSKLHSLNKFVKKYEARVRNVPFNFLILFFFCNRVELSIFVFVLSLSIHFIPNKTQSYDIVFLFFVNYLKKVIIIK